MANICLLFLLFCVDGVELECVLFWFLNHWLGVVRNLPKAQVSVEQSLELVQKTECLFLLDNSVATDFHFVGLKVGLLQIPVREKHPRGTARVHLSSQPETEANKEQGRTLIL